MGRTTHNEPFDFDAAERLDPSVGWVPIRSRSGIVGISLVDIEDAPALRRESWHLGGAPLRRYALSGHNVPLHRMILGLTKGDDTEVDHINGNQFDNRRANLRVCTRSENMHNKSAMRNSSTGIRGVSWNAGGYWCATLNLHGKRVLNAFFKTKEEAIAARLKAESEHGIHRHDRSTHVHHQESA